MSKNILFKKLIKIPIYEVKITLIVAESCRNVSVILNGTPVNTVTNDFAAITYSGYGNHFGLLFDRESTTVSVIAHEVFHLTHRILDFVGANFDNDHHECAALLNGYLMDTVIKELSSFTAKNLKRNKK